MKVRDLMTRDPLTATPDMPLKEAARLMTENGVSGLPVIDADDHPVGLLSEADFVKRASSEERAGLLGLVFGRSGHKVAVGTVGEAMSSPVVTIGADVTHNRAAHVMERKKVKRLPVVDVEGRLIGVLSRSDVLSVFARPDTSIESHIRSQLVGRLLLLDPNSIGVEVKDAHVMLTGEVPTKNEKLLLDELAAKVDGVLSVESDVRYRIDDDRASPEPIPFGSPRPNW